MHRGFGTVIHPGTTIGNDVTIYHGVTIGRADPWIPGAQSTMHHVYIDDGAMLCPGAKILCKAGTVRVGAGSIIGANAVLTQSTGPNEIWAGAPARKVGMR
jgi:serine O-acetyltransferase